MITLLLCIFVFSTMNAAPGWWGVLITYVLFQSVQAYRAYVANERKIAVLKAVLADLGKDQPEEPPQGPV